MDDVPEGKTVARQVADKMLKEEKHLEEAVHVSS